MMDRIGQQFGNYRLIRSLGYGGFAEVYQGEHIYLKSYAAIKVLHMHLVKDDIDAFLHEARTLVHLIHPNIVRLLDFGIQDSTPFLVMDYAPNNTLRYRHPKGTLLGPTVVVKYVRQIAEALHYAHNRKIIHRDVKPENMLIGRQNEILLGDFGIAIVSQSSRHWTNNDAAGTITYMAPEQIQAHPRASSDQYSLAVVVYEWLTGKPPFHGTFAEVAGKHLYASPLPICNFAPSVPPLFEQAVLKALAKDPERRFADIQAFARALEQTYRDEQPETTFIRESVVSSSSSSSFVAPALPEIKQEDATIYTERNDRLLSSMTEPVAVDGTSQPLQEVTATGQQQKPAGISRRMLVSSIALSLAGVGGMVWLTTASHFIQKPSPTPSPAAVLLLRYRGHSDAVYCAAWSHNGRYIVSGGNDLTMYVWEATNGQLLSTYRRHTQRVNNVVWSPDDTLIASASNDKTAQVWRAKDAKYLYTYSGHINSVSGGVTQIAWSPDGKYIASGSHDKTIQVWNASNGHWLFTYYGHASDPDGYINALAWSPDGTHIASGGSDSTVQVWNANNGHIVYIYPGHTRNLPGDVWTVAWSPDSKYIVSGSKDKTAQVWEALTGKLLYVYHGHTESVGCISWSHDGKRIVSGSYDKTVQVWSPTAAKRPFVYLEYAKSPKGRVWCVDWAPDSKRVVSSSDDGSVLVWKPPE